MSADPDSIRADGHQALPNLAVQDASADPHIITAAARTGTDIELQIHTSIAPFDVAAEQWFPAATGFAVTVIVHTVDAQTGVPRFLPPAKPAEWARAIFSTVDSTHGYFLGAVDPGTGTHRRGQLAYRLHLDTDAERYPFLDRRSRSSLSRGGWSHCDSMSPPYGISTMAVEPGFFRTDLLVEGSSTIWPELDIEDYTERTEQTITAWKSMNGQQGGEPKKLADALVTLSDSGELPLCFLAGADVIAGVDEQNLATIQDQIDANRDLRVACLRRLRPTSLHSPAVHLSGGRPTEGHRS